MPPKIKNILELTEALRKQRGGLLSMTTFWRASFLFIIVILIANQLSVVGAAAVDLPDANKSTMTNPSGMVRVYETDDPNYYQYINGRFAFTIKFPTSFSTVMQAGNNGGARFSTPDKQSNLSVWGSHNALQESLSQLYQKRIEQVGIDSIAYQASGNDWYVLSWVKDGMIFYEKEFVCNEYLNGFSLSYPEESKDQFDNITTTIEQSFVPGWKSGRKIWG